MTAVTQAAMSALMGNDDGSNNDGIGPNNTINADQEADEFGTELGGWYCFTKQHAYHLRMWLNDRPNMTSFVSWKIPDECQLDTSDTKKNAIDYFKCVVHKRIYLLGTSSHYPILKDSDF
jgi:hypothetical protein